MQRERAALFVRSRQRTARTARAARDGAVARGALFVCLALTGGSVLGAGCGGAPTRSFDGAVYREGAVAFQVPPAPREWTPVQVTDASLAFRDDPHGASILLNGRCLRPDEGTPLVALTNHLIIGSTAREVVSQEVEAFDGREALHTRMRAKWDGVPIAFDIYVLKKDGCVYDFVYMGDPSAFEAGSREFEAFARGFRTLPGSGLVHGSRG